jgi:hypothetical protein
LQHRELMAVGRGFWAIWLSGSCGRWRGGRSRISGEVRALRPALFFHRFIKTSDEGRFHFICVISLPSFR